MKILITGANGFIGKHLVKEMLNHGHEVFAIVTNLEDLSDLICDKLHCYELFFDDYKSMSSIIGTSIDLVYHLAWSGLCGAEAKNVDIQVENIKALSALLLEVKKMNVKKFIFSSTMNTIDLKKVLDNPISYSLRGTYIHVSAKLMAEVVARAYCEENNIDYNQGIIAMTYGPGNKSKMISNLFIYNIINNIPPKMIEGKNQYDVIFVNDVASALRLIGENGINKKSYYIGHNWNKTFKEIFTEIRDILNPSLPILFGQYKDESFFDFSKIDRDELKRDTGWEPVYDFKQSIIETANWINKSGLKF